MKTTADSGDFHRQQTELLKAVKNILTPVLRKRLRVKSNTIAIDISERGTGKFLGAEQIIDWLRKNTFPSAAFPPSATARRTSAWQLNLTGYTKQQNRSPSSSSGKPCPGNQPNSPSPSSTIRVLTGGPSRFLHQLQIRRDKDMKLFTLLVIWTSAKILATPKRRLFLSQAYIRNLR